MKKSLFTKTISLLLCFVLTMGLLPTVSLSAEAANNWDMKYFLKKYSDPHFDLRNDPYRTMTVEEFIAIIYAYSYYGDGASSVTAVDKNGKSPSAWCGKYIQAEVNKGVIDPHRISWSDPVTLAFAAQYLSRAKGKYSYDSNNIYSFTGISNLSTDDILYLNVAVDHGLIPYTPGMDVSKTIQRRNARTYEIPSNHVYAKPLLAGSGNTMRECNSYFIDCYWDLDAASAQLNRLKALGDHITMVTFQCGYINEYNVDKGNTYLGFDVEHEEAVSISTTHNVDPQLLAISYCHTSGKTALLGISNAGNNVFSADSVSRMLQSPASIQTAVNEIMYAVRKYDFDGVNIGIEIASSSYSHLRDKYSSFLQQLGSALRAEDRILMVTTGAYFTDAQEKASIYDYSAINRAADLVHIILYDDFNDTGYTQRKTHGPMSNLIRMGRCLRYASIKIDKHKILPGFGSFAIDFNLTWCTAQDISYQDSTALRQKHSAPIVYANENGEAGAYFEYTDSSSCKHRVYLETPDTVKQRINLVKSYNLGGYSVFSLNDNYPDFFTTLTGASSYKSEVMTAMSNHLIPNSIRGQYDKAITRAEFCSIIAATIEQITNKTAEEFLVSKNVTVNHSAFKDTSSRDVLVSNALGIVLGYGNGEFRPNNTITRQEAATMLMRLAKVLGLDAPNASAVNFDELPTLAPWAQSGVNFISACLDPISGKRVMGGTGNNKFSPYGNYTREQSIMTAVRLFNLLKKS